MTRGGFAQFIKKSLLIPSLALVVLLFQNCGLDGQQTDSGLFNADTPIGNGDCLSETVDCGPSSDYLQISLDMTDNQVISSATTSFKVNGRCNTGNFPTHLIYWEVIRSDSTIAWSGSSVGACVRGRYTINTNVTGLTTNSNCTVSVKIIGQDEDLVSYENFGSNGSAQIDFSKQ